MRHIVVAIVETFGMVQRSNMKNEQIINLLILMKLFLLISVIEEIYCPVTILSVTINLQKLIKTMNNLWIVVQKNWFCVAFPGVLLFAGLQILSDLLE